MTRSTVAARRLCMLVAIALLLPAGADAAEPPFFSLGGQAGLPKYLKCNNASMATLDGLLGGEVRTSQTDLFDKDFTLDLIFAFKNDADSEFGFVGIGENGKEGGWVLNSVLLHLAGPACRRVATEIVTHKNPKRPKVGQLGSAGPHFVRMTKKGGDLTFSIWANTDEKASPAAKPDFSHTVSDLPHSAAYLTRLNSSLFFGGNITFRAVRLSIAGTPAAAGTPANAGFKDPANSDGLIRLKGGATRLPPFMEQAKSPAIGRDGITLDSRTSVRTRASNYLTKNFTFDVVYRLKPDDRGVMMVGLGANRRDGGNWVLDSAAARLHGITAREGAGAVSFTFKTFHDDYRFGELGKDKALGPNLLRLQKRGDTLSAFVYVDYKADAAGLPTPECQITAPSLKSAAPTITDKNSCLFIDGGGVIEAIRLVVDGEAVDTVALEIDVPSTVTAGEALRHSIVKDAAGKRFTLESGPAGMTLSPEGVLSWKPTDDQTGKHSFKIIAVAAGKRSEQPMEIEVSAPDAATIARNVADRLVSSWTATGVLDDAKLRTALKQQGVLDEKMPGALADLKTKLAKAKMILSFAANGSGLVIVEGLGEEPFVSGGRWAAISAKGDTVRLRLTAEGEQPSMLSLTFNGNDEFAANMPEELKGPLTNPLTFRRSGPPSNRVARAPVVPAPAANPSGAAPAAITAEKLVEEFSKDIDALKKQYKDKRLAITGKVAEVNVKKDAATGPSAVSITLIGRQQAKAKGVKIVCNFPSDFAAKVEAIKPDSIVEITGEFLSASKFMEEMSIVMCSSVAPAK